MVFSIFGMDYHNTSKKTRFLILYQIYSESLWQLLAKGISFLGLVKLSLCIAVISITINKNS